MIALLRGARRVPLSIALLLLIPGIRVLTWITGTDVVAVFGIAMPYTITDPRIFSSGLTVAHPSGLVLAVIGVLAAALGAELVLGTRRFALTVLLAQLLAVPIGLIAARGVEETELNWWGADVLDGHFLSPVAWIVGSLAVASAFMQVLWRRRVRAGLLTLLLTLVLYSGTAADIVGLTALTLGVPAGIWLRRAGGGAEPVRVVGGASIRETRNLVATVTALVAVGPVLAAMNPAADGPLSSSARFIWAPAVTAEEAHRLCRADHSSQACADALTVLNHAGLAPTLANLAPVVLQLIIALGLRRGRRSAWWFAVAAQVISAGVTALQLRLLGGLPENSALALLNVILVLGPWVGALALLLHTRGHFGVRTTRARVLRFWAGVATSLLTAGALWVGGALLLAGDFHPHATLGRILAEIPARLTPPVLYDVWHTRLLPSSTPAWLVYEWSGVLLWAALGWLLWRLLSGPGDPVAESDRRRARELLRAGTGDHLAWMTLWAGNHYWFAADGAGYVAYRPARGVAVTLGAPVFSPGAYPGELATGFERHATAAGLQVAWYSVSPEFAALMRRRGWNTAHVAEEAVLDTGQVEFRGKKFQNIRTALNRAEKEGVQAQWTTWREAGPVLQEKMIALSEEWVGEKALPEMGFTLGGIEEMEDPDTALLLAVDASGHLHAMTSWLPVFEGGRQVGLTLDVMRRDAGGFRPAVDFLIARALRGAAERGLAWISLSGAPLAPPADPGVLDGEWAPLGATLGRLGALMEPLYGFRSLAAAKHKFQPEHRSWFLCYADELALPAIGLAVTQCYLPEIRAGDVVETLRSVRAESA